MPNNLQRWLALSASSLERSLHLLVGAVLEGRSHPPTIEHLGRMSFRNRRALSVIQRPLVSLLPLSGDGRPRQDVRCPIKILSSLESLPVLERIYKECQIGKHT